MNIYETIISVYVVQIWRASRKAVQTIQVGKAQVCFWSDIDLPCVHATSVLGSYIGTDGPYKKAIGRKSRCWI